MKQMLFFAVLLCFGNILLSAAGVPKFYSEETTGAPKPRMTGTFQSVLSPGYANDADTPKGMSAGVLSENGKIFTWKPSPDERSLSGEAAIADALLSNDESTLIVAETVGGFDKPNATRIVFINLFNGRVCGGFLLEQSRIVRLAAIPGRALEVLGVEAPQECFDTPAKIVRINLKKRKIAASSASLEAVPTSLACDGEKIFYTLPGSSAFYKLDLDDFDGTPQSIQAKVPLNGILLGRNGKTVMSYGKGFCEYFEPSGDTLALTGSFALPDDLIPDFAVAVDDDGKGAMVGEAGKKAYFVSGGAARELPSPAGNFSVFSAEDNILYAALAGKGAIIPVTLPTLLRGKAVKTGALKPVTSNHTFKLFVRSGKKGEVLLLDCRGNLFVLTINQRRSRKQLLLLTDQHGMK